MSLGPRCSSAAPVAQEHRNIQIPAADEDQGREIKLRAPPADPYYHGNFHDTVRAKVQDPVEQGRRHEFACDRAIDSIESRACSNQQNSSGRRAAGEGHPRHKACCDAQDGRAVGAESKAKKCAGERKLYVPCRGPSAENCVEHKGDRVGEPREPL
jgi:hypothetical protein